MEQELFVEYAPKSGISESIKKVRTNLQFSAVNSEIKTILVTSSISGEGKSFVSSNLAVAFAKNDQKVLIVDCDMRKGRQHRIFEVPNGQGLSNLLLDNIEENLKYYIKKTNIPNLSILTRGIVPPNPSELLNSKKNKELVNVLKKYFNIIIFDSVPVQGLSDSIVMARLVDKVVITCALKQTPIEMLKDTKKQLAATKCDIAGIVVNKVPKQNSSYYENSYYEN